MSTFVLADTVFTVDLSSRAQTIENIGSSTGMHGDFIARYWNEATVDQIAELLFSRDKGIGLSCFRIQIGAGSEGEEGGIRALWRRTDCFLQPDGSYDWSKGSGTTYWRKKAEIYGVETVIGYLNSVPVNFTENGFGFKTDKEFTSNLKSIHYEDYAEFIATVAKRYQQAGVPFSHISPVNEPQWAWEGVPGKAKQEGSPWTNQQIARLVRLLDAEFRKNNISTRILIPEAADYHALYEFLPGRSFAEATDQLRAFWNPDSPDYVGNLSSLERAAAGHAYFNDASVERMLMTRRAVKEGIEETDPELRFWQSEYCLLGKGWMGELPAGEVDEMTAALLLARNIHVDFVFAHATAWQWWSSTEPKMGRVPRYCLIEADAKGKESFRDTKLLWALGHYSRFVRPGMIRLQVDSGRAAKQDLESVMASAFIDPESGQWAMVLINLTEKDKTINYTLAGAEKTESYEVEGWITSREKSMDRFEPTDKQVSMPPKSIVTLVTFPGRDI